MDAIGFDAYNYCLTGKVAMSIRSARNDTEHLPCAIILDHHPHDSRTDIAEDQQEVTPTIREHMGDNQTAVAYTVDMGGGKSSVCTYQEQSPTLACTHYGEPAVAYGVTTKGNAAFSCGGFGSYEESCTCGSLRVKEPYGGGEALIVEPLTFDARGNGGAES